MDRELLDALIPELTAEGRRVSRLQQHLRRLPAMPAGPAQAPRGAPPETSLSPFLTSPPAAGLRARPVSEMELAERFHALLREHAELVDRAAGELVDLGDLVQLDVLAYRAGEDAPFSARAGVWTELSPTCLDPQVYHALSQAAVGERVEVELPLPSLGSAQARALRLEVWVAAAREVHPPDPERPQDLRRLGRGASISEVMQKLAEQLGHERISETLLDDQRQALLGFAAHQGFVVPEAWVDAELEARWHREEGAVLARRGRAAAQQEGLSQRLRDADARSRVKESFQEMLALEALATGTEPKLPPDQLEALVHRAAQSFGLSLEAAREALAQELPQHEPLQNAVWYLMALESLFPKHRPRDLH